MSTMESSVIDSVQEIFSYPVNNKGFVVEKFRDQFMKRFRVKIDNRTCFDCRARNPTWISLSFSILICLTCSGNHRRFGTHVSFVRSSELDQFTKEQLVRLQLGGNEQAIVFFKSHGRNVATGVIDYDSKLATKYKEHLDKLVQTAIQQCGFGQTSPKSEERLPLNINPSINENPQTDQTNLSKQFFASSSQHKNGFSEEVPSTSFELKGKAELTSSANRHELPNESHTVPHKDVFGVPKSMLKVKRLNDNFSFDEAAKAAVHSTTTLPATAKSETADAATVSFSKPEETLSSVKKPYSSTPSQFANAKSISSSNYFSKNEPELSSPATRSKLASLQNCKAISYTSFRDNYSESLDDLYNRNVSSYDEDSLASSVGDLTDKARTGFQFVTSFAKDTVSRAKEWLSDYIAEDNLSKPYL